MNYIQKQTYQTALSDLELIARSIKEAGYLNADAQAAHHYLLKATDALNEALDVRDVLG